ncbi:hypothetical protein GCM10027563_31740 [Parasphingorhabdus pacifica]
MAYWESMRISSGTVGSVAWRSSATAVSSPTLFVASPRNPDSPRQELPSASASTQANPVGRLGGSVGRGDHTFDHAFAR